MKLLVCGGRDFDDIDFVVDTLCDFHDIYPITQIISGMAKGADSLAAMWAEEMGIEVNEFPADWNRHGNKAGFIRNKQMLDEGNPDAVYAFAGGKGTNDMVSQSEKRGIDTYVSHKILFNSGYGDHKFLSNFATGFSFHDEDGVYYPTSEHYYQAMKSPIESERSVIQCAVTAKESKKLGSECNTYKDWDTRKLDVMKVAINLKFAYGSDASELLLDTNNDYLVEYCPWNDVFWGVNKSHVGENHLGKMLMDRRLELINHL